MSGFTLSELLIVVATRSEDVGLNKVPYREW